MAKLDDLITVVSLVWTDSLLCGTKPRLRNWVPADLQIRNKSSKVSSSSFRWFGFSHLEHILWWGYINSEAPCGLMLQLILIAWFRFPPITCSAYLSQRYKDTHADLSSYSDGKAWRMPYSYPFFLSLLTDASVSAIQCLRVTFNNTVVWRMALCVY